MMVGCTLVTRLYTVDCQFLTNIWCPSFIKNMNTLLYRWVLIVSTSSAACETAVVVNHVHICINKHTLALIKRLSWIDIRLKTLKRNRYLNFYLRIYGISVCMFTSKSACLPASLPSSLSPPSLLLSSYLFCNRVQRRCGLVIHHDRSIFEHSSSNSNPLFFTTWKPRKKDGKITVIPTEFVNTMT